MEDCDPNIFSSLQHLLGPTAGDALTAKEKQNQRYRHDSEFKARRTTQLYSVDYLGSGRSFPEDPILFQYLFTERPHFGYGVVSREGISNLYIGNATAYVVKWLFNNDKYYGCKLGLYVDVRDINDSPVNASVALTFDLTFIGVTIPIPVSWSTS